MVLNWLWCSALCGWKCATREGGCATATNLAISRGIVNCRCSHRRNLSTLAANSQRYITVCLLQSDTVLLSSSLYQHIYVSTPSRTTLNTMAFAPTLAPSAATSRSVACGAFLKQQVCNVDLYTRCLEVQHVWFTLLPSVCAVSGSAPHMHQFRRSSSHIIAACLPCVSNKFILQLCFFRTQFHGSKLSFLCIGACTHMPPASSHVQLWCKLFSDVRNVHTDNSWGHQDVHRVTH
jgi:hypothetical protein